MVENEILAIFGRFHLIWQNHVINLYFHDILTHIVVDKSSIVHEKPLIDLFIYLDFVIVCIIYFVIQDIMVIVINLVVGEHKFDLMVESLALNLYLVSEKE